jgi:hypothetical protein
MKNTLVMMIFLIICGCSNNSEHKITQYSDLSRSMDAIYFAPIFMDKVKDGKIDIKHAFQELSKEYNFESEQNISTIIENKFTASYKRKSDSVSDSGYISCEYLGNWHGKDIVYRRYETGGTGKFTDIVVCSQNGNTLQIHDIIFPGDRAVDGMIDHPIYGENGKIYFSSHLSTDTLFEQAGVQKEDSGQCYSCYYVIGKCTYDLESRKTEIVGMNIIIEENDAQSKIKTLLLQKKKSGHSILNKDEVKNFLQKLRELY